MKISDIEVITFKTRTREHRTRWGKERWANEIDSTSTITSNYGLDWYHHQKTGYINSHDSTN